VSELKIDRYCIPYPKKGLYWIINIPYLLLLILTAIYLWQFGILISATYISLYIISVILHGYVCAFSGCPYKGKMCPGAFAHFRVGEIALLYDKPGMRKSDLTIELFFALIMIFLLGIITLPLYWISILGIGYAIGYVVIILAYFIVFNLTICLNCAMRFNCPMAKLSNVAHKKYFRKDILGNQNTIK
jgi:hypothetical protein